MSLDYLFYPKSVALIGASKDEGSVGNEIAKNLKTHNFKGKVYFVNPKGGKLFGQSLIPDSLKLKSADLAIIAIPAPYVLKEIKKLITIKVKAIVVISAGFGEVGNKKDEEEMQELCTENEIVLIGPNCLGFINSQINLNASFASLMPKFGSIAFLSQSGALCASVLDYAARERIGFSKFISLGNKAQTREVEILEYLYKDPKTKIIALYIEELQEAELVKKIAEKITKGPNSKPIIVLKSGISTEGKKAALSHTGSLGGSNDGYEAFFTQSGIIRAQSIQELFDIIETFQRNKTIKSAKVAVITNAGGPGVLAADALSAKGLQLAQLTSDSENKLKKILPGAASIKNPIDILGDADYARYEGTLKIILSDENVDAVEIILTPQSMTDIEKTALAISKIKKQTQKPIVVTFMGQDLVKNGVDILNKNEITTTLFPEESSSSFSALNMFSKWRESRLSKPPKFKNINKKSAAKIIKSRTKSQKNLKLTESFKILKSYGFPVPSMWLIKNKGEALTLSKGITGSSVLKISSPDINHKTDIGGVVLNVESSNIVKEYESLINRVKKKRPKATIDGVLLMPQIESGIELILGVKTDPNLGKQILVGLGGIYAEVLKDTSWGIAPLSKADIKRMIGHLKVAKILSGARHQEPYAIEVVEDCIGRLSQLAVDFPEIEELDINPLEVLSRQRGAVVVDTRIAINSV